MRQRPVVRAFVGAWLLWFTTTVVQEPGTRLCPVHAAQVASHAGAHGGHASHASHAASHSSKGDTNHQVACDCPDECRCGAPVVAMAEPASTQRCDLPARAHDAPQAAHPAPVVSRAHVLPFANAPPAPIRFALA